MWQVYFSAKTCVAWTVCGVLWRCRLPMCGVVGNMFSSPPCWWKDSSPPVAENDRACLGLISFSIAGWLFTLENPCVWGFRDQRCSSEFESVGKNNRYSSGFGSGHSLLLSQMLCQNFLCQGASFQPVTHPLVNCFFLSLMAGKSRETSALRRKRTVWRTRVTLGKYNYLTKIPCQCSEPRGKDSTWHWWRGASPSDKYKLGCLLV